MASKNKKIAVEETWETIVAWVETESPKKGRHGKKANKTRGTEKETYEKIHRKKKS